MSKDDRFYIKELQPIRELCSHSDKEDVYEYIYSLQQDKQQLQQKVNQLEDNWNKLKEYIRKTKIKEFEKAFGKRYGKTFTQAEIIVCNMLIEKMQELEGGSNE